jgi:hypothetical protein
MLASTSVKYTTDEISPENLALEKRDCMNIISPKID